ncbi:GntR family transcriptional regulator [Cloacibacillus porcorum]|uniref:GntR family transcriptional regulator n=1 Tax=Cloacibacillus porcorum TaxID=1197717 RepID=UPI0023F26CFA|nr:GntR family transcriptional regulator [Cloacibacillus porcorum]MDD7650744.1 GntR family transcriptional regulator [Cloacibacillus porcorum]MDY4093044.1 GntR family transcriptional regulator [Cloacibacillus porcorum]
MRGAVILSQTIYRTIKEKIECGLYPVGSPIPSCAELCKMYRISEKTARRVVEILEKEKFIETSRGKRPRVIFKRREAEKSGSTAERPDYEVIRDISLSARVFYYPLLRYGLSLCTQEDFDELETRLSCINEMTTACELPGMLRHFWRFFVSKIGNAMILRCIDSIGYLELVPMPYDIEFEQFYREYLFDILSKMRRGSFDPQEELDIQRIFLRCEVLPPMRCASTPASLGWPHSISANIRKDDAKISAVYMDIIGRIVSGEYKQGDILPSHAALCKEYGVSHDSTSRAIRYLRELKVIRSERRKSVVALSAAEIPLVWSKLDIKIICRSFRSFIDALETVSLTIEDAALLSAGETPAAEAAALRGAIGDGLRGGELTSFCATKELLEMIVSHIPYRTLREIYLALKKYTPFDRVVPGLLRNGREEAVRAIYQKAYGAANALASGENKYFAELSAKAFQMSAGEVLAYCKDMGYLEATMKVYDGTIFLK